MSARVVGRPLLGERFGRLTVIGDPTWRPSPGKRVRLESCRCDCGELLNVDRRNLMAGRSTSCGCLTIERSREAHRLMRDARPTYAAVHIRLSRDRGAARDQLCSCGAPGHSWAYDHTDPDELTDALGLAYSVDQDHYTVMCRPCHVAFDAGFRAASRPTACIHCGVRERVKRRRYCDRCRRHRESS